MPATSPIHQLVIGWWRATARPSPMDAQTMREALFTAAVREIGAHIKTQTSFDPIIDHRFKWAVQYLELIEGSRKKIDPDIILNASLALEPTPFLSRKDLAANES